jgi:hypothetical protein
MHAKRYIGTAALALLVFAGSVQAQDRTRITVGTGAGGSFPVGSTSDLLGFGWNAQANLGLRNPAWPVGLRLDLVYNVFDGDNTTEVDNDRRVLAGLANLELKFNRNSDSGFFIVGGPGYYSLEWDAAVGNESQSDPGIFGGAGYRFAMTNLLLNIEGKYHHVFTEGESTKFIPLSIVAEIPLGGGGTRALRTR